MTATWNGEVIARSDATVVVEGNHYFPAEAVADGVLAPSSHTSFCPWKGTASYYSVSAGGAVNENAAWSYPEPKAEAQHIEGHFAFWRGVEVTEG
ncbi:MAG: DUF427 domain-containing protein [Miltoncostaeaceae bacterium]